MERNAVVAKMLVLFGLLAGIVTITSGVKGSNIDELVTVFSLISSGGFVLTGSLSLLLWRTLPNYTRFPGGTLVVLGADSIVWGFVSFMPFRSAPVLRGLLLMLIIALAVIGSIFVFAGLRWAHRGQMGYPLGIISGTLIICLSCLVNEWVLVNVFVGVLIALFAVLVAIVIGHWFPAQLSKPLH